jgi:DNA polymerase III delta prime subunit
MNKNNDPKNPVSQIIVEHAHWHDAIDSCIHHILHAPDIGIVALVGPTGVGKTQAIEEITRRIMEAQADELKIDTERMPVVAAEVATSDRRSSIWPATFKLLLRAMKEPFADGRVASKRMTCTNRGDQARFDFETAIEHRRPYVVILDEFHHLIGSDADPVAISQIKILKSLANRTKTTFLIVGTQDMLRALSKNGESGRRTKVVPFPRYRGTFQHRESLREVLEAYQRQLGGRLGVKLSTDLDYVLESTVGCVGLIRNWLVEAWQICAACGESTITRAHLDEARLGADTLTQIFDEARACERFGEDEPHKRKNFAALIAADGAELDEAESAESTEQ